MEKLKEFFQETSGCFSSARLIYIVWALGLFVTWALVSVKTGTMPELPESTIVILGLVAGGKVVQRFGEK